MITGVQDVYYNVTDMSRAVAFYRDVLGMTLIESSEHWSTLECGAIRVGLHGTGGQAVPRVPHDAHGPHAGGTLTLACDDIQRDARHLQASGAKLLDEVRHHPWGSLVVFEDTEGNILKLMQPPGNGTSEGWG